MHRHAAAAATSAESPGWFAAGGVTAATDGRLKSGPDRSWQMPGRGTPWAVPELSTQVATVTPGREAG